MSYVLITRPEESYWL